MQLEDLIKTIPDFPKSGVLFRDISPLLANAEAWKASIEKIAQRSELYKPDVIAGIESRGFLIAAPLALRLGLGFVMIRKLGKLPGMTKKQNYNLEYGSATLEVQEGLIIPGQKILVVDDILATGGTMVAAIQLLRQVGGVVKAAAFLIELLKLEGREKLGIPVESLIRYPE